MKGYALAATKSLLKGWLSSLPAFLLYTHCALDDLRAGILPWLLAVVFIMVANVLFVQWPRNLILRFAEQASLTSFTSASAAYAFFLFTLLIGWAFIENPLTYSLLAACAILIGSTAGFSFYQAYRKQPA